MWGLKRYCASEASAVAFSFLGPAEQHASTLQPQVCEGHISRASWFLRLAGMRRGASGFCIFLYRLFSPSRSRRCGKGARRRALRDSFFEYPASDHHFTTGT